MKTICTDNYDEFVIFTNNFGSNPEIQYWSSRHSWSFKNMLSDRFNRHIDFIKKNFINKVENYLKDMTICDLASASGDYSFLLADRVKHIDGYDLSSLMIEKANNYAKNNNIKNVSFYTANAIDLNFKKKYDAFMVHGLFTYIFDNNDVDKCIKKIYTALVDGRGGAASYVSCKDSLVTHKNTHYYSSSHNNYVSIFRNYNDYITLWERNGFKLVSETNISINEETEKDLKDIGYFSFAGIFQAVI